MTKNPNYPTWKYKSRKAYVNAKKKQWDHFLGALWNLQHGCAWLPKRVKDFIMNTIAESEADKAMQKLYEMVNKKSRKK